MWINLSFGLLLASAAGYGLFRWTKEHTDEWWAVGMLVAAWVSLTIGLVQRGLEAGHWPLTNSYESILWFVWAVLAVYLALELTWRERHAGLFVLAISLLAAGVDFFQPAAMKEIPPFTAVLHSTWQQVHLLSASLGYGILSVAAGLGLSRLWIAWRTRRSTTAANPTRLERIDWALERLLALGFICLTFALLSGAIWTWAAFGHYFAWEPAQAWALVTWLVFLLINHARLSRAWRGQRLAWLSVIGLGFVLVAYLGTPWISQVLRLVSVQGY